MKDLVISERVTPSALEKYTQILYISRAMKEVIRSLDRNEPVTVIYHGKAKGTIVPLVSSSGSVQDHAFFGMSGKQTEETVDQVMDRLRASSDHAV